MYGIYINCHLFPFVAWILSGRKAYETRGRNMLRALIGQRVALIETGKSPAPMVRGFATIASAEQIDYSNITARKAARILGTSFDILPGGTKWFYKLTDIQTVEPLPVPDARINHGRAWTEFVTT